MNARSVEVLLELIEILKANSLITLVSTDSAVPLASETNDVAVYIQFPNIVPRSVRNSADTTGYDYQAYFVLNVNVDCADDEYRIYDIADSIQKSILNDSQIWNKLVDRNIITVEFDNSEFAPKRAMAIPIEVLYRLEA